VCLDDKRRLQNGTSDILLAYLRGNKLYNRTQRDRFEVEDYLADIPDGYSFVTMGMNTVNRVQFQFDPPPEEIFLP
jgi:hypothetical protein